MEPSPSPEITDFANAKIKFYSKGSIKPLKCQLMLFIKDWIFTIILFFVISAFIASKIRSMMVNRRTQKLARDLYGEIKSDLERSGPSFALSKNDIMRKYCDMPKISSDNLNRDERTFRNTMWPLLEGIRKGDRSMKQVQRVQRGHPVNFWELK